MMAGSLTLPEGRQGQALAAAMTLLAFALLWFAAIGPLLGWYQSRAALLTQQQAIAAHMAALGQEIPSLRAAVRAAGPQSAAEQMLLPGATDAIAGANLQSALQSLATQAGTSLDSVEMTPVQTVGALRQISVQVSVTAPWPVLITLFEAIGTARPRMIVGQLSLLNAGQHDSGIQPVQANFSVSGFAAAAP
jgi:general secretion pathway protein M